MFAEPLQGILRSRQSCQSQVPRLSLRRLEVLSQRRRRSAYSDSKDSVIARLRKGANLVLSQSRKLTSVVFEPIFACNVGLGFGGCAISAYSVENQSGSILNIEQQSWKMRQDCVKDGSLFWLMLLDAIVLQEHSTAWQSPSAFLESVDCSGHLKLILGAAQRSAVHSSQGSRRQVSNF